MLDLPRPGRAGLLAAICYGLLGGATAFAGPDPQEEGLPEGAIARFGTTQRRALCDSIRFSPGGKTLLGVKDRSLVRVWDAADGKLLRTQRLSDPSGVEGANFRSTSGGDTLLVSDGTGLKAWDLFAGKRLGLRLPRVRKRLDCGALSADRRLLFYAETLKEQFFPGSGLDSSIGRWEIQQRLALWDTTTAERRVLAEDESQLVSLAVAPQADRLASSSYGKGTCVWDARTGKLLWRKPKFNAEMIAFTPDGQNVIAAPGGGQSAWHVWDAASGQPSKTIPAPTLGYVWLFALSPDGKQLLAPTVTDYVLWDLPAGRVLQRWPSARQAGKVAYAPDGRSVVTADTVLRRWEVAGGKPLYPDDSRRGHGGAVRRLFFTPDGKRLVSVGAEGTVRIWDVAAAKLLHTLVVPVDSFYAWTLTPDGSRLVGVNEHLNVYQWSVTDGHELEHHRLAEFQAIKMRLRARELGVAPDGETLVLSAWGSLSPRHSYFSFWELQTGRFRRWGGNPGDPFEGDRSILSPDGRYAYVAGERFDTMTGERRRLRPPEEYYAVFSPDGRLLATRGNEWHIWEAASGQTLIEVAGIPIYQGAIAPDGRQLAAAEGCRLAIYDLPTARTLRRRSSCEIRGKPIFSPDGRTVATGHVDGTILLWDALSPTKAAGRLSEREAAALWDDLGGRAADAWRAVWRLRQEPAVAVSLFRKRLPPVPGPTDEEWRKLIGQLDSDRYEEREAASRRLASLGSAAGAALRRALSDRPTPEQQRRIKNLLNAAERSTPPTPSDVWAVRVVAILEGVNTSQARRLLKEWADGLSAAPLREEAVRALERMKWRPVLWPDR